MITPAPSRGQRSRKDLACTAAATAHQRAFVADLKRRVIDNGEPFAIAQADTPHEIFHAMDIPLISNQWWSAYISAKQLSPRYFEVLDKLGYPVEQLPLLLAGPRVHARQRSGDRALGRTSQTHGAGGAAHLRMHSPRLRPMGRGAGQRVLSARGARLDAQGSGLVHEVERRVGRALRAAPHRIAGPGNARAHRAARGAHRPPLRRGEVRRADARDQRAGRLHRRSRAPDRQCAPLPRVDRRPDAEHDDSRSGIVAQRGRSLMRAASATRWPNALPTALRPAATNACGSCGSAPACGTTPASTARSKIVTARSSCGRCTCRSRARSTFASFTTGRCTRWPAACAR